MPAPPPIRVAAATSALPEVTRWVAGVAAGLDADAAYRLRLVVEELVVNVAEHARPADGTVRLAAGDAGPDAVWVLVEDGGPPFDPRRPPRPPGADLPPERRPPGSMGLVLVAAFTDDLRYERRAGRNRARLLVRTRPAAPG